MKFLTPYNVDVIAYWSKNIHHIPKNKLTYVRPGEAGNWSSVLLLGHVVVYKETIKG